MVLPIKKIGFFLLAVVSFAQSQDRLFERAWLAPSDTLYAQVSDGTYQIFFYNDRIIETTFVPRGEKYNNVSHAVVLEAKKIPVNFKDGENKIIFSSKHLQVHIQKKPFNISYLRGEERLIDEGRGYVRKDSIQLLHFNITPDEYLYGGGARVLGMNRRGHFLELYNKAHYGYETHSELMNYTMPIVISSNRYLIHFDNPQRGYLDLDSKGDNSLSYQSIGGRKTYQVVAGDSWAEIIRNYTLLTGRQPLPPIWALGNFASRFGYHSEKQARDVVNRFRKDSIPLDAIIFDLYWFGKEMKGNMGNLKFLKDSFPNPQNMIGDFKREGVKTVLVTEPFILNSSRRYTQAIAEDVLAKNKEGKHLYL